MFDFSLEKFILRIPAIILALTVHEVSHGFAAYKLGDTTAKYDGRLSFNPLKHLDPIGFLCLLVADFGWAKPVMVNPYNLRHPKQDMALISFAGPFSNFLFAFVVMLIFYPLAATGVANGVVMNYVLSLLIALFSTNIGLGIFNLLPIPPLDGSKVFGVFLPEALYYRFTNFRYGFVVLIILIYTGATTGILMPLLNAMFDGYFFLMEKIYFFL